MFYREKITLFNIFIFSITSNRLKENVRHSLWAKVMWPQGPVGKVNTASKELFTHLMEAHKTADTQPAQVLVLHQIKHQYYQHPFYDRLHY